MPPPHTQELLTRGGRHLPVLAGALLQVAIKETGTPLASEQLLAGCQQARRAIHAGAALLVVCV